jgi:hypothetical protein
VGARRGGNQDVVVSSSSVANRRLMYDATHPMINDAEVECGSSSSW